MVDLSMAGRHRSRAGLSYERRGEGPPVVLLHAWCLSGGIWMYQLDRLSAGREVIVPDLAGFGESRDAPGSLAFERHASDVLDLLEELDLTGVTLAGFAFGAVVAMHAAAAQRHGRVASVVSMAVPSSEFAPYAKMPRSIRADWPAFCRRSAVSLCPAPISSATSDWLERMFLGTPMRSAIETVEAMAAFDPLALAPSIEVPIRYLHGAADPVVPSAVSRAAARLSPLGTVVELDGVGHLIVLEAPDQVQAQILDMHKEPNR